MTEKKISRRDAMKLLGAAVGAVALANLPSKWNTPELAAGVLPAHARQSGAPILLSNVALNKTATASSLESSSYPANNAIDGNSSSRWSSDISHALPRPDEWFRVDLESTYTISEVVIQWENAFAVDYDIQVSDDGATWSTVASVIGGTGGTVSHTFTASNRYVRVYLTQRTGGMRGFSMYEFEVWGY